jgi:excisionase family DNA binding protein
MNTRQELAHETLLKGQDVARILNISRSMAYGLMQRGEIATVLIGRSVRVRPVDLEEFIRQSIRHGYSQ